MNESNIFANFQEYFGKLTEPRQPCKITHLLDEILFIVVLAVISGSEDFDDIAFFANKRKGWLSTFLKLPGGIPSHDTFNRVLCALDPSQFEQAFIDWISYYKDQLPQTDEKDVVPIDGKTICNSKDTSSGQKAVHMVSAMSTKYGLILVILLLL